MFRRRLMQLVFPCAAWLLFGSNTVTAQEPPPLPPASDGDFSQAPLDKIPTGVIIVKGAEPSSSDRSTPLPEDGEVIRNVYRNRYLGLSYPLPPDWTEAYKGPPPSDCGNYVLSQLVPSATFKGPAKGTVLISAQDMFFARMRLGTAMELVAYHKEHLPSHYEVERPPAEVTIGDHSFARFDYGSSAAQLHWSMLATQIRCHTVEFVFTSRDAEMVESLIQDMARMQLPPDARPTSGRGGGDSPVCIADYATTENLLYKVDPVFTDRRFNAIPVRFIIGKNGKVRHVHVISAFPDQASKITDALLQWAFKPYMRDGKALEVETGMMFGSARIRRSPNATSKPVVTTD